MEEVITYPWQDRRRIRYRRDLRNSYMIVEGNFEENSCEKQMLQENRLSSLLPFSTVSIEERTQFWYDITGRRSLADLLRTEGLSAQTLVWLFCCLEKAHDELALCLISPAHVPLDPEMIFVDGADASQEILLCYCPESAGSDSPRFLSLMDLIITCVNEQDRELYDFCFELHTFTARQDPTAAELRTRCEERFPKAAHTLVSETDAKDRPLTLTSDGAGDLVKGTAKVAMADAKTAGAGFKKLETQDNLPSQAWTEVSRDAVFDALFQEEEEDEHTGFFRDWPTRFLEWLKGVRTKTQKEPAPTFSLIPDVSGAADGQTTLLMETPSTCRGYFCYEGSGQEPDFAVRGEEFHIGSSPQGNDAVLTARTVSRHHARVLCRNGRYYLEDLNSRNGTRVNGQLLEYHQSIALSRGDRVQFASERYRVD